MLSYFFCFFFMTYMVFISNFLWIMGVYVVVVCFFMLVFSGYLGVWQEFGYIWGMDLVSLIMILLSFVIFFYVYLSGLGSNFLYFVGYNFILFSMIFVLVFLFSVVNLFMFYLLFECSLIPISLLIMGWGKQRERLSASVYLMLYMLASSLPLMVVLMVQDLGVLNLNMVYYFWDLESGLVVVYFLVVLIFLVSFPLYVLHLWLPSAHVEASVEVSMILAGILLKLGGYGLYRFMSLVLSISELNVLFVVISYLGMFLVSFNCLCQVDISSLVAYSSVVHMGMCMMGCFVLGGWGMVGLLVLMVSHGLCSSGLFYLIGVVYDRFFSRSLYVVSGLIICMPSMGMGWFLLCSSNLSAPPSLNLLGEIMVLGGLLGWSFISCFFLVLVMLFSAFYSLYLYSYLQHGDLYSGALSGYVNSGFVSEYLVVFLHWVPLNLLFVLGDIFF